MYNYVKLDYTENYLEELGTDQDGGEWLDLHYEILYSKYIYYQGVTLGFVPMSDESYDKIESRYKELSIKLGKKPTASDLVGWKANPILEALAMRKYNKELYDKIKTNMFIFKR